MDLIEQRSVSMLPFPLAPTRYPWFHHSRTLHLSGLLAGALLLAAVTAGCGAMSRTSTATPTATATATPTPLPPAPAGVYVLTQRALDVLSLADGTLQRSYPYTNPAADTPGYDLYDLLPPVVSGGAVYFAVGGTASYAATVMALRATDGSELWSVPMPSRLSIHSLSVVDGTVYIEAYNSFPGYFFALSAKDGHLLWQIQKDTIWGATVADGVVYLSDQISGEHLLALRAADGTQLWDLQVPTCGVLTTPAVDNGMVFLSCTLLMGDAYGVRASDGKLIWHQGSLGLGTSRPLAGDGLAYVVSGACGAIPQPTCPPIYLYAFDEQTGALRWRVKDGDALVLTAGALYCNVGSLFAALDPSTGFIRRRYSLPNIHSTSGPNPTIVGGVIYLEGDEQVFATAATTGALLWHSPPLTDRAHPNVGFFVVPQAS
jgi:outer membrane protein assembly factor BamB